MNKITDDELIFYNTVRNNIKKFMAFRNLDQSSFLSYIEEKNTGPVIDRTTFYRFMNSILKKVSLYFLHICCKSFSLSIDNLVSNNFNPKENIEEFNKKFSDYYAAKHINNLSEDFFSFPQNEIFISNPDSPILKNYMQTYYCYYYSTVSSENKASNPKDSIIKGTLNINKDGTKCVAELSIDTKKRNDNGHIYKIYTGRVVICPSIQSVHVILYLPEGEFCFIIFRYSHLNTTKQLCRVAEVLSTSSTLDRRYPTVHRMLLSNEPIKDKDLPVISPYLCLNYSDITISKKALSTLRNKSTKYYDIIENIPKKECEEMYRIKEDKVSSIAQDYLDEGELVEFITELRTRSLAYRYNKVSAIADANIKNLLDHLGYYKEEIE